MVEMVVLLTDEHICKKWFGLRQLEKERGKNKPMGEGNGKNWFKLTQFGEK